MWSDVISSINIFNEAEISNSLFAIFGGPNETESTLQKGLENINNLNECVVFAYSGIRILPKTKIYSIALTEGIINNSINLLAPKFYFSPHLTAEYIDKAVKVSFGSRMDRIYPPDRDKMLVHSFHKMGYKGPIWDLILKKRHLR